MCAETSLDVFEYAEQGLTTVAKGQTALKTLSSNSDDFGFSYWGTNLSFSSDTLAALHLILRIKTVHQLHGVA